MPAYRVTTNGKSVLTTRKPAATPKIVIGGEEITDAEEVAAILAIRAKNSKTTVEEVEWQEAVKEASEFSRDTKPVLTAAEDVRRVGSVELLKGGMKVEAVKALAQTSYNTILNWVEPTIEKKKTLVVDPKVKAALLKAQKDEKESPKSE
jgi:hypothetical protein